MDIKREQIATAKKKEELVEQMKLKVEELGLGEPQGKNEHGPVYVSQLYDLRIEKDPGYGEYKLMLMYKLQPPQSLADRLLGKLRGK